MRDRPLYNIGTAAELLDVHPETLRVWERHRLLKPVRRKGRRCYTDADLQRLLFIRHLIDRWGLNLSGVRAYVQLYPCWWNDRCPSLRCTGTRLPHAKPCWRRPHAYCASPLLASEPCGSCSGQVPALSTTVDAAARPDGSSPATVPVEPSCGQPPLQQVADNLAVPRRWASGRGQS